VLPSGCNKLQRKLLFADSLAQLPYRIGAIRGVLTNLATALGRLETSSRLTAKDIAPAYEHFVELQHATTGLCRSSYCRLTLIDDNSTTKNLFICKSPGATAAYLPWRWTFSRAVIFFR
jgi:hypothetical protein